MFFLWGVRWFFFFVNSVWGVGFVVEKRVGEVRVGFRRVLNKILK